MNVTVITPPPFQAITLAEVYRGLRLDTEGSPETHPHDAMLMSHIAAACADVEKRLHRTLVRQTLRVSHAAFPVVSLSGRNPAQAALALPGAPVDVVSSVQYYDAENTLRTVDPAYYYLTDEQEPRVRFTKSFVAPITYDRPDAVRVTYTAGYPPAGSPPATQADYAANIPQPFKQACILGVQALYDDLQPADWERLQRAIEALVQPHRVQITV